MTHRPPRELQPPVANVSGGIARLAATAGIAAARAIAEAAPPKGIITGSGGAIGGVGLIPPGLPFRIQTGGVIGGGPPPGVSPAPGAGQLVDGPHEPDPP